MTYVVKEECIKCKYTDCVEVCPVDCFHEGPNFLVIDPEECIDCSLCEPECPVGAIVADDDLESKDEHYLELNEELSAIWPVITEKKPALDDADVWAEKEKKYKGLDNIHSPVAGTEVVRLVRKICCLFGIEMKQLYVRTAFD